jgi:nitrite reductase (NADH) large subunit
MIAEANPTSRARASLVVVGNGMAGFALCQKLAQSRASQHYRILVFGEEPRPAYDRVRLTQFFSGCTPEQLLLAPRSWYEQHQIELRTGDAVVEIDRDDRCVRSTQGREASYDWLVLATGSRPFVPPIRGTDLPGVFVYRTIEDLEAISDYSRNVRNAAVLGGGLLGLEAAKALYDLGLTTHIVEVAPGLMPRQLDADGAALLQRRIEQLGVRVHLLRRTQTIEACGPVRVLHFSGGQRLEVDMVVISAGIRPRDELAAECGLEIGDRGGIVVNERLQTCDPSIFAIGECAVHCGTIYGLVGPAYQMAEVVAANLLGGKKKFPGGDPAARLKLMGIEVCTLGRPLGEAAGSSVIAFQGNDAYRKLLVENGRLVGATSVGPWPEIEHVRHAVAGQRRLWHWQIDRFVRSGNLFRSGALPPVEKWPEQAIVCACVGVTRGALSLAQARGCATVEAFASSTGASTACGSCRPLLAELAGALAEVRAPRGWQGLLAASCAAMLLVAAIWLAGPIPFAETVDSTLHAIDIVWRDAAWKQATGYTLVALSLAGLLLSARKRWKRFSRGDYGLWRMAHGVLGLLTLVGLIVHTGLHLGSNLNFALASTFLGLNFVGAMTGLVAALESRTSGAPAVALRRWRPRIARLHILLLWPLPALLVFHIICVYYF